VVAIMVIVSYHAMKSAIPGTASMATRSAAAIASSVIIETIIVPTMYAAIQRATAQWNTALKAAAMVNAEAYHARITVKTIYGITELTSYQENVFSRK
jgi:hypothetical protein